MIDTSEYVKSLGGHPVAVFGLGRSGLSSVEALCAQGAKVFAWDDSEEAQKKAEEKGAKIKELNAERLSKCAGLVMAPGISLSHAIPQIAKEQHVEILSDIEILSRCDHGLKTIGVTGTNGKSTTVSLIHHVLQMMNYPSVLGGNIGTPVLSCDLPESGNGVFVLELSSYQIDICPTFRPDISVLLNITPDHLDRHGSLQEYASVKEEIFAMPQGEHKGDAIIAVDDEYTRAMYNRLKDSSHRTVWPVSVRKPLDEGVYVEKGILIDNRNGARAEIGRLSNIQTLKGTHNHQNAACVYAALLALGLKGDEIFKAFSTYPGLSHRQYVCRVINGVSYVNDSKATNAEAASKALDSYDKIYWIAGGIKKDGGLDGMDRYVERIKHAFVIGDASADFGSWFEHRGVPLTYSETLGNATKAAHESAQKQRSEPGGAGVVLLSPACSSFDQFTSFEERGAVFENLVSELSEVS